MPVINTYDIGDEFRAEGRWTDSNGTPVDPAVVKVDVRKPNGLGGYTVTTYQYGVDPEVSKASAGVYRINILVNIAGKWYYRWYSETTYIAADERRVMVREQYST